VNSLRLDPLTVLLTLSRSVLDAYGMLGFGHYLMSAQPDRRKLLAVSAAAGVLMAAARFIPVSMGVQVSVGVVAAIAISALADLSGPLTSTGAGLLGSGVAALVEWMYVSILLATGRAPAVASHVAGTSLTLPCAVFLALLAHVSLTYLKPFPAIFKVPEEPLAEDYSESQFRKFSHPVRDFFCVLLFMALVSDSARGSLPAWAVGWGLQVLMPFAYAFVLWCSALQWRMSSKGASPSAIDFVDIGLLHPLTHVLLTITGGDASPYKALYLPLIILNSLKPGRNHGVISTTLSISSLTLLATRAGAGRPWANDVDVIYSLLYILTFYLVHRFIVTETALVRKVIEKASQDDLTELFNHGFILSYLDRALSAAEGRTYLIMADLDNFKILNDSLGHLDGDALLKAIARNLKKAVRGNDIVARYGGDEFVVVPENVVNEEQVIALAERIRKTIEDTCAEFAAERRLVLSTGILTASAGIACTSEDVKDRDSLIRTADRALYMAKARGKNRAVMSE